VSSTPVVSRLPLGRLGVEEAAVELDGGVEVGDVEGELETGHGDLAGWGATTH
jgi:hypothetical protein